MKHVRFIGTLPALFCYFLFLGQPQCSSQSSNTLNDSKVELLVFTKTSGYRHKSIEKGVSTLRTIVSSHGFEITHTDDAAIFTEARLSKFQLVIFLSTTMDILNTKQEEAFKNYFNAGGSFMGIHAASDTEYDWPWYGKLVGAYFESHPNNPNVRTASIQVLDKAHPSTAHLEDIWERTDEWYNFKNINPEIRVLMNLDETSYEGGTNGEFHPIAWYHEFDGGRVFYTGGGHTEASFDEVDFQQHLLGGIRYCLGLE